MSLKIIEGFDTYTADHPAPSGVSSLQTGRFGGKCARVSSGASFDYSFTATDNISIGFAHRSTSSDITFGNYDLVRIRNSGTDYVKLHANPSDGSVNITDTTGATHNSASGIIAADAWTYFEVVCVRHSSAGTVTVKANGTTIFTLTGINTGYVTGYDSLRFAGNQNVDYDDLFVRDDTTFVGEVRVETLYPNADTADKDFTPSTGGTNYNLVADFDGDTDYVSSATPGDIDRYAFDDLASTPTTIHAVQTRITARKDDVTTRAIRASMDSGGTIASGVTTGTGTSYADVTDIFTTDPNTSAAWTASGVNAVKAGPEVVT
jgi:hypothetical protein